MREFDRNERVKTFHDYTLHKRFSKQRRFCTIQKREAVNKECMKCRDKVLIFSVIAELWRRRH